MQLSKFTIITLPYKKFNRAGFTYEARNRVGDIVMQGIASCTAKAKPFPITIQEAMIEACSYISRLGIWVSSKFCSFVIDKDLSRFPTGRKEFWWLMIGLIWPKMTPAIDHALFVPKLVNSSVNNLAKLAYIMPIQSCMVNQTAFVTWLFSFFLFSFFENRLFSFLNGFMFALSFYSAWKFIALT